MTKGFEKNFNTNESDTNKLNLLNDAILMTPYSIIYRNRFYNSIKMSLFLINLMSLSFQAYINTNINVLIEALED